jgi:hypothetical protein
MYVESSLNRLVLGALVTPTTAATAEAATSPTTTLAAVRTTARVRERRGRDRVVGIRRAFQEPPRSRFASAVEPLQVHRFEWLQRTFPGLEATGAFGASSHRRRGGVDTDRRRATRDSIVWGTAMSAHSRALALVDHMRHRLLLDLFAGAFSPMIVYRIGAIAEAYGIDVGTVTSAIDDLRADRVAIRPLDGRVAFMPWTAASMHQRAVDLRYLAAHSPVRVPPPAPLADFRAAPGPSDLEVGLRFAGRVLDVPGYSRTARRFERNAAVFSAYFTIRATQDPVVAEELRHARKVLVHLLDSPFENAPRREGSPVDSLDQQVVVKRALVAYLHEHERLHGLVREPTAAGAGTRAQASLTAGSA